MFRTLILGLSFALLYATWSSLLATAQDGLWEKYMAAGRQALEQRDFPAAEKQFAAALSVAERDGPETERVATTLFGHRNVGFRGMSGPRFRATEGPLVAEAVEKVGY